MVIISFIRTRYPGEVNPMSLALVTVSSASLPLSSIEAWAQEAYERNDIYHNIACINHISTGTCSNLGRENIQMIVERFELNSYRASSGAAYKYCNNPITQLLLDATWYEANMLLYFSSLIFIIHFVSRIPLHWIPYCPKLDQYFDI